jgi:(p)ppGpp synthase/HD superfamily hydrolase
LKWELEDLSLRALEPAEYKQIARHLDERGSIGSASSTT